MTKQVRHSPLTFSDAAEIFRSSRRLILLSALFCAALFLLFALLRDPLYEARSSFREKKQSLQQDMGNSTSLSLLLGGEDTTYTNVLSTLSSRNLLGRIAEKHNLQAELRKQGWLRRKWDNIRDNFRTEISLLKKDPNLLITSSCLPVEVSYVIYNEETPTQLRIQFTSEEEFDIVDTTSGLEANLGTGHLGTAFRGPAFTITLKRGDFAPLEGQTFEMTLSPLADAAETLQDYFYPVSDVKDPSLIKLSFYHKDRQEASDFLNALTTAYMNYLREEQQRVTMAQLSYLRDRQSAAEKELRNAMERHAQALSGNMGSMETYSQNQQAITQKLLAINLELIRLRSAREQGIAFFDKFGVDSGDPVVINELLAKIREYESERNAIIANTPHGEALASDQTLPYKGVDYKSAGNLYQEQCKCLSEIEAKLHHNRFVQDHLADPNLDLSALTTMVEDPISRDIVAKASSIELQSQDRENHTARELERLQAELAQQKAFLKTHVEQSSGLLEQSRANHRASIAALQQVLLELIQNKIAIHTQQLETYIENRISTLEQERRAFEEQQQLLQREMEKMPGKWATEKMVDQQLEVNRKIAEELSRMVESKNLNYHLDVSLSTPLDKAIPPTKPRPPRLILLTILGALVGSLAAFSYALLKELGARNPSQ